MHLTVKQYLFDYMIQNKDLKRKFIEENAQLMNIFRQCCEMVNGMSMQNLYHSSSFIMFKFKYLTYQDKKSQIQEF